MTDVMLDLETMGRDHDAAIIAIGAVQFDLKEKTLGSEFYIVVDLASAMAAGGTISADTVLWWMQQSDEARAEFNRPGKVIDYALRMFSGWVAGLGPFDGIWGNGATFDNVILRTAFNRLDIPAPWNFRQDRCFRTVKAISPPACLHSEGTEHKALDDAKWQARYLMEVL